MIAPEFSRPIRIDALGDAPWAVEIAAEEAERRALARRFDLVGIDLLAATAQLRRTGDAVAVEGRITARVVQSCVATAVPLPAAVDMPFELRFVPQLDGAGDEIELDQDDLDVVSYEGGAVDLGEAVAETLALALDSFPRAPDAEARLRAAGVKEEGEVEPMSALAAALKDKLN